MHYKEIKFTKWENKNEIFSLTNSRRNVIVLQIQNAFFDFGESRENLTLIKQLPEIEMEEIITIPTTLFFQGKIMKACAEVYLALEG